MSATPQMSDAGPRGPSSRGSSHRSAFKTSPLARAEAIVGAKGSPYRFTVLDDGLVRYEYAPDGVFEDRASTFAINRDHAVPNMRVVDNADGLQIVTGRFHLFYDKRPFSSQGLRVQVKGYVSNSSSLWRYGYHHDESRFALGGTVRTLDKADGRVPLGTGVIALNGYAEIDDSQTMLFTEDGWIGNRRPAKEEIRVDGYLFVYGHDYKDAIKALYALSGPPPVLPRWALGNWWSRHYIYTSKTYLELVDHFAREKVPLSVAVLDMEWHWVNDDRVRKAGVSGWTGYSWDRNLFPNPKQFLEELHGRGLKVSACDHPSEGIACYEDTYERVCEALGQDPSLKETVPFDIANKAYLDAYFDIVLRHVEDDGLDFWWQDWQQGPFSSLAGADPLWILNHFHYLNMQRDEQRPFIFSRFAGPGSHRYPIGFSGDTCVTWQSLDFQPEFTATASNMGFGWWSNDIGGFMNGYRDDELVTRWVQLGVFSPILRLHSALNAWMSKEPWKYPLEARHAQTEALRLRHRLVPYLYSMNVRAARDSEPLVQPVYYSCARRAEAYWNRNTFFFGSELFVAPLTTARDRVTQRAKMCFWLPPGRHVDLFSGTVYDGDRQMVLYRRLEEYAVFAREGSIVPMDGETCPSFGAKNPSSLEVRVVVGADGAFELDEDDGRGSTFEDIQLAQTMIRFSQSSGTLTVAPPPRNTGAIPAARDWAFTFVGFKKDVKEDPLSVEVDGTSFKEEHEEHSDGLKVMIPAVSATSRITVRLGKADPQLALNDFASLVSTRLHEAQAEYRVKKLVWATVTGTEFNNFGLMLGNANDHSLSRKVAELHSFGLDAELLGSLIEVLTADRRCERRAHESPHA